MIFLPTIKQVSCQKHWWMKRSKEAVNRRNEVEGGANRDWGGGADRYWGAELTGTGERSWHGQEVELTRMGVKLTGVGADRDWGWSWQEPGDGADRDWGRGWQGQEVGLTRMGVKLAGVGGGADRDWRLGVGLTGTGGSSWQEQGGGHRKDPRPRC